MPCTIVAPMTNHTAADSDTPDLARQTSVTPARAMALPMTVNRLTASWNSSRATAHGHQRGSGDDDAGGAGRDVQLPLVEQQLVGRHAEEPGRDDPARVSPPGHAGMQRRRDHGEHRCGHGETNEGQPDHAKSRDSDLDRWKRARPQHDHDERGNDRTVGVHQPIVAHPTL
jgi:hypothetical protein